MAYPKESEPLQKITLNIYTRDYERLKTIYFPNKAQVVIRAILRAHVQRVDQKIAAATEKLVPDIDVEIPEDFLETT